MSNVQKLSDRPLSRTDVSSHRLMSLIAAVLTVCLAASDGAAQCRNEYTAGAVDDYTAPTETAVPDPALAAFGSCGAGGVADFDAAVTDQCVAHTFTGIGTICGARLCFAARPSSSLASNDAIQIGYADSQPWAWTGSLRTLPESGGTWTPSDNPTGATFCLDLANLPGTGVNLIPLIGSDLDVYIQDDTSVDFMTLTTTCCGCEREYPAGIDDDFAGPPEPTSPNAALAAYPCGANAPVDFNESATDQCVIHTFDQLGVICGATLAIHLKPTAGGSDNDKLAFYADDGVVVPGLFSSDIVDLPNASPPTGGTWDTTNNPNGSTFVLDLANLPGGISIIEQINQAGLLDVLVEDDTAVDSMTLTTTCCPHSKCYRVKSLTSPTSKATTRTLEDQFGVKNATIQLKPFLLCTPTDKGGEDDRFDERNHTICYKMKEPAPYPAAAVSVTNQFGAGQLVVGKPTVLCVPTTKSTRTCVGGVNAGSLCTAASACPGGVCAP